MTALLRHRSLCRLLEVDPDLAEAVAPAQRERATEVCVAASASISPGAWDANRAQPMPGGIGLLILDGLLVHRVMLGGRFGAELLGAGDLLQPWEEAGRPMAGRVCSRWRVIREIRLAILDAAAATRIAQYPSVIAVITSRAVERAQRLSTMMAIIHHPRIEDRLHMLLWHIADRWGHVRRDGVHIPFRLSHSTLADLVACQRPSVTVSLTRLTNRGVLQTLDTGWLLLGEPPTDLLRAVGVESPK